MKDWVIHVTGQEGSIELSACSNAALAELEHVANSATVEHADPPDSLDWFKLRLQVERIIRSLP